MINPIKHFALTWFGSVHDEEALSSLELQALTAAKVNEAVDEINKQVSIINRELEKLSEYAADAVDEAIEDGTISVRMSQLIWDNLTKTHQQLIDQLNNLILNAAPPEGGAAELVDARQGHNELYATLGAHVRALGNGNAFADAIRPGTVRAGRLMAGMLGGDLRDRFTLRESIPMAGHWTGGSGYFNRDTLELMAHTGYTRSEPMPCKYGDTFILESYLFGPLVSPAVIYDADMRVIDVQGKGGASNWDMQADEVHITTGNAAFISFVVGAGYESKFRASRVSIREASDREMYGHGKGYVHARAKKRTDTVTDRAQIKCWFKLPADHSADRFYTIPIQLLRYTNLGGWTMRLFAAASGSTYETQLGTSASAYNYPTSQGLRPYFKVPVETSEGLPVTHVCLFIDLLPARPDEYINAYVGPLEMLWTGGSSDGTGYTLHGAVATDAINTVWAGAASSPLYNKRILGIGDSLMAGNRLPKSSSWFNKAAGARDMVGYNAAVNGQPVGGDNSAASKITDTLNLFGSPDYAIVQGGANDLRLGVSLDVFRAALHTIVDAIQRNNPRCKILFATNWRRSDYVNNLGLSEGDYVAAMMEEAESMRIPYVNNYARGIDLTDAETAAWADEGIVSGEEGNIHFSEEANDHIVPVYISALEGI